MPAAARTLPATITVSTLVRSISDTVLLLRVAPRRWCVLRSNSLKPSWFSSSRRSRLKPDGVRNRASADPTEAAVLRHQVEAAQVPGGEFHNRIELNNG